MARIIRLVCRFFYAADQIGIPERRLEQERQEDYCGDIYPAQLISGALN